MESYKTAYRLFFQSLHFVRTRPTSQRGAVDKENSSGYTCLEAMEEANSKEEMLESPSRCSTVTVNGREDPSGSEGGESFGEREEEENGVHEERVGGGRRLKPLGSSPEESPEG